MCCYAPACLSKCVESHRCVGPCSPRIDTYLAQTEMELGVPAESRPGVKHRSSQHPGDLRGEGTEATSGDISAASAATSLNGLSGPHAHAAVTAPGNPGHHAHHSHHHGVHIATVVPHVHAYDSEGMALYKKLEVEESEAAGSSSGGGEPSSTSRAFSEAFVR